MIIRYHYINQIRPFYDSDLIKVITGIRRCGKSVILFQIEEELRIAGKQVLYINFENIGYSSDITDAASLDSFVKEHIRGNESGRYTRRARGDGTYSAKYTRIISLSITGFVKRP